ncbi:MAG: TolC family protein [Verrucomicrobia bacterium]|nr:TolC family protein [Verrucomicrobiota bacterium]
MFLAVAAVGSIAAQPMALTLEEALSTAERVNSSVLLGREAALQAIEQANVARVGLLPTVNANAAQRRTRNLNILSTTGALSETRPSNRFDARFAGSYSLLNPQVISAAQASRVGVDIAQAELRATVQASLTAVAQAYFAHLRNLRRLDVLDASITRAKALFDLARNQFAAGTVAQIDVTRAEAQLAQAEQARLQQVTTAYQSELAFKRLLNLDPALEIKLADFAVRRVDASLMALGDARTSFEQRAEWLRAQKAVDQSRLDVRTASYERLPSLALSGDWGRAAGNFDDNDKRSVWTAGVALSIPIFDGLRAGADKRSALSRQRMQEARLRTLELQISSELRLARQDASSRNAQIAVAEKNLRLAEEQLHLARARYHEGVADNREVVEAQNQLAIAADNVVDAVYQYNLSRVELARARGDVRTVLAEKSP